MERTPEPELMIEEVQAEAYAKADFDEPHSRFISLLRECFPALPERGVALDLGCGPGDIGLRFARVFPSWMVDGLDGSPAMVRLGREAVRRAGLVGRVNLFVSRLPGGKARRESYDLVFSNSLLHHLADPGVLWSSIRRWAQTGIPIFVMDLLRPSSRRQARRLVEEYTQGEPEILKRDFHNSLLAAYRPSELRSQLRLAGLGHLQVRTVSDRHFIIWGRR